MSYTKAESSYIMSFQAFFLRAGFLIEEVREHVLGKKYNANVRAYVAGILSGFGPAEGQGEYHDSIKAQYVRLVSLLGGEILYIVSREHPKSEAQYKFVSNLHPDIFLGLLLKFAARDWDPAHTTVGDAAREFIDMKGPVMGRAAKMKGRNENYRQDIEKASVLITMMGVERLHAALTCLTYDPYITIWFQLLCRFSFLVGGPIFGQNYIQFWPEDEYCMSDFIPEDEPCHGLELLNGVATFSHSLVAFLRRYTDVSASPMKGDQMNRLSGFYDDANAVAAILPFLDEKGKLLSPEKLALLNADDIRHFVDSPAFSRYPVLKDFLAE